MASLFHGVLMELTPSEYADYLHLSQLHPYSQHLEYKGESWYWIICGLNKEAVQTIIVDSMWNVNKITPKMFFRYNGEDMSLTSIYNKNKKRRGRSRYLLSVMVDVVKDGKVIPAKVVYVRNRNKRKEYLCIISTNTELDENEIIRIYGKRWDIEVFFKVCKKATCI